jgi:hypothetical protein
VLRGGELWRRSEGVRGANRRLSICLQRPDVAMVEV